MAVFTGRPVFVCSIAMLEANDRPDSELDVCLPDRRDVRFS